MLLESASLPCRHLPILEELPQQRQQPLGISSLHILLGRCTVRVLDGIHGVQLGGQPTYGVQRTHHGGDFNFSSCDGSELMDASQRLLFRRIWWQQAPSLRPIRCSLHGDQHVGETIANVLSSLPFIVLGLQAPRKNLKTSLYANSLLGVGIASSVYHSSRGKVRRFLRWVDYTMIAVTTICLSSATRNENPKLFLAASALLLPVQPFMVSVVHTGLMEVAFARRAQTKPELRMAHSLHTMSTIMGGALFFADDCFPNTPYIHAAWHLAAAVGVGTCNKLLE